jgi:hypothetical protein
MIMGVKWRTYFAFCGYIYVLWVVVLWGEGSYIIKLWLVLRDGIYGGEQSMDLSAFALLLWTTISPEELQTLDIEVDL